LKIGELSKKNENEMICIVTKPTPSTQSCKYVVSDNTVDYAQG